MGRPARMMLLLFAAWATGAHGGGGHTTPTHSAGTNANSSEHDSGELDCDDLIIHSWFHQHYEYFHLENWVLASLVVITMVFEFCWHFLVHRIEHAGQHHHEHEEELERAEIALEAEFKELRTESEKQPDSVLTELTIKTEQSSVTDNASMADVFRRSLTEHERSIIALSKDIREDFKEESRSLYATLTERCAGELMVLGFLAWVVWSVSRAGLWQYLACRLQFSHISLPPTSHGYQETIEDVHMHLFLTMTCFIGILGVSVFIMHKVEGTWARYDAAIQKAVNQVAPHILTMHEVKDFRPKGEDPFGFTYYAKSRRLLFGRLAYHLENTEVSAENRDVPMLLGVLEELHNEMHGDLPFLKEKIPQFMDQWFSFHAYAKLMCHYLMTDLVEIKLGTWLFVCMGLLVSAGLLLATENLVWHVVVICTQLVVALTLGIAVPLYLRTRHSEALVKEEKIKEEWLSSAKMVKKITEEIAGSMAEMLGFDDFPHISVPRCTRVEDFPMFSMQMFIFFWVYNTVRICGANYWWYRQTWAAGTALGVLFVTIPVMGFILGRIIASMALIMARGDISLNGQHISWIYVLACRELQKVRRSKWENERAVAKAEEMNKQKSGASDSGVSKSPSLRSRGRTPATPATPGASKAETPGSQAEPPSTAV